MTSPPPQDGDKKVRPKWADPNYDRAKRSQKHENRLANRLGGKRLPMSGAKQASRTSFRPTTSTSGKTEIVTAQGDIALPDVLIEHKRTDTGTMSIKREWWEKVAEGAKASGKEPALLLTFEFKGRPFAKPIDLVAIPLEVYERLRGNR
jgi:hypothetical protein